MSDSGRTRSPRRQRDDSPPWWEQDRNRPSDSSRGGHIRTQPNDRASAPTGYRAHDRRYDDRMSSSRGRVGGERFPSRGRYPADSRSAHYDPRHKHFAETRDGQFPLNGMNSRTFDTAEPVLDYDDSPAPPTAPAAMRKSDTSPNVSTNEPPSAPARSAALTANDSTTATENSNEFELEVAPEIDPEAIIAERRRKRAEILAKYAKNTTSQVSTPIGSSLSTPEPVAPLEEGEERETKRIKLGTNTPEEETNSAAAGDNFDLFKGVEENEARQIVDQDENCHVTGQVEVSAADYNPDEDRKNDERKLEQSRHKSTTTAPAAAAASVDLTTADDQEPQNNPDDDDDDDDMFSIGTKPPKPPTETEFSAGFVPVIDRTADAATGLVDNFDDGEGYYKLLLGEVLDNGRYHVHANLGKGMFSGVVRAKDTQSASVEEVAIKIIRSQESMYKAGLKEANILRKLEQNDPEDKKHVIRLLRTFEHRNHLCLVFESLSMNLREVVKRFGKDVGINLRAVRAYASQMFLALALLKKCDVMHADIKPDNILVNESKSILKICDLGSASDVSENDITPYLVSRFYRAPEIILGLPYDCALDVWSIACTLYELYTGKILFPGRTNNHMLLLIMELKGKFNHKLIKKAKFGDQHFDEACNFLSTEADGTTKIVNLPPKARHDLRSRLIPPAALKKLKEDEAKMLTNFVDLLDKMLSLEPSKRPAPKELLSHPFIRG